MRTAEGQIHIRYSYTTLQIAAPVVLHLRPRDTLDRAPPRSSSACCGGDRLTSRSRTRGGPLVQRGIDLGGCRAAAVPGQIAAVVVFDGDGRVRCMQRSRPTRKREASPPSYVRTVHPNATAAAAAASRALRRCRCEACREALQSASFACALRSPIAGARGRFVDCCLDYDRRPRSIRGSWKRDEWG